MYALLKMKLCFYIIILISESYEINSTVYLTIKGTETQTILGDGDRFPGLSNIESIYANLLLIINIIIMYLA